MPTQVVQPIMRVSTFLLQNVALATGYILRQSSVARHHHHPQSLAAFRSVSSCSSSSLFLLPTQQQQHHQGQATFFSPQRSFSTTSDSNNDNNSNSRKRSPAPARGRGNVASKGWVQDDDGEWQWEEDDPNYVAPTITTTTTTTTSSSAAASSSGGNIATKAVATPQLPAGVFRPKKSLGQNYLKDPNTVLKIIKSFHQDATHFGLKPDNIDRIVELGPGAGALTDRLVELYGTDVVQCIEIDERSIGILQQKHPNLQVTHADILQVDYPELVQQHGDGKPLVVIGNLPYYITSQILFALADASHFGAVDTATVTMQWEVGQRMVAPTRTKDYGILSVVFQLYADVRCHFKIPPTVFYPAPKVDSALIGVHFLGPDALRKRFAGVSPIHLRRIVTTAFQQRRKTVRNSLKKLAKEIAGDDSEKAQGILNSKPLPLPEIVQQALDEGDEFASQQSLPENWATKRPEELTPGQFIELTRIFFGPENPTMDESKEEYSQSLGVKVWRKMKHGKNL